MPVPTNWTSDNVTEVAVIGVWSNGHQMVNVFHVRREEDDAEASARDVLNNWQDHLVSLQMNNYSLIGARFRDRNEEAGVVGFIGPDNAKPKVGGQSAASAIPSACILVHKNIVAHVGDRAGRFYFGPCGESDIDEDGILAGDTITSRQDGCDDFFAGLSGAMDNELVVIGQSNNAGLQAKPSHTVTGLTVDRLVATQRRRLR